MKTVHAALLAVACLLVVACREPPSTTGGDAQPSPATPATPARLPHQFGGSAPAVPPTPAPPDTRTPAELAQAACEGADGKWHCKHVVRSHRVGAGTVAGVTPASWTVPAWYIDPANGSGTADDGNDCATSSTACMTWGEVNARWGCFGNPTACPRLRQNTTITFLSSQSGDTDPVYFLPAIEHSAYVVLKGNLGTGQQICSTTLGVVTAKNRGTPQLLNTTFASCTNAGIGQLVVNSTHSSRAWIYKSTGGGAWNISQPVVPNSASSSFVLVPSLVDTWANGDTVTVYQPPKVNIAKVVPAMVDFDPGTFNNRLFVYNIAMADPAGAGDGELYMRDQTVVLESSCARSLIAEGVTNKFYNSFMEAVLTTTPCLIPSGGAYYTCSSVLSGVLSYDGSNFSILRDTQVDGDVIATFLVAGGGQIGTLYSDTGATTFVTAATQVLGTGGYTSGILWGPGSVDVIGSSRLTYRTNAGGAAATFVLKGSILINGGNFGCLGNPGAASAYATCNIGVSAANLDVNLGAASGCIGTPNGAAYCNYGL